MNARLTKPGDKRVLRGQSNQKARQIAATALLNARDAATDMLLIRALGDLAERLDSGKAIGPLKARKP